MWKNKCHISVVGKSDQNFNYTVLHTRGQVQKVSHSLHFMNVMQRLKPNLSPQCSSFYTSWSRETFSFSFSRICCVWNKAGDVAATPQTAESIQPDSHHIMTYSCCIMTASKLCPASPPWWQLDIRQLSAGVLMRELLHRGVTWEAKHWQHCHRQSDIPCPADVCMWCTLRHKGKPITVLCCCWDYWKNALPSRVLGWKALPGMCSWSQAVWKLGLRQPRG